VVENGGPWPRQLGKPAILICLRRSLLDQDYVGSFSTLDCEGLVFLTQLRDPYGKVVVDPHD
jgi:hypothetical protein